MNELSFQATRCLTCGTSLPTRTPVFDHEEGRYVRPEPYCSIHCEHYAGLQRATAESRGEWA